MKTRNGTIDHMQQGATGMFHGAPHEFTPVQGLQTNYDDSDSCSNDESPRLNANRLLRQTANHPDSALTNPDFSVEQLQLDGGMQQRENRSVKRSFKPQADDSGFTPLAGSLNHGGIGSGEQLVMGNPLGNQFGLPGNIHGSSSPPRPVMPSRLAMGNNLNDGGSGFGGTFNPSIPTGANLEMPDGGGGPGGQSKFGSLSGALPGSPPVKRSIHSIKANADRMASFGDDQKFSAQSISIQANTNTGLSSVPNTTGTTFQKSSDGFTNYSSSSVTDMAQDSNSRFSGLAPPPPPPPPSVPNSNKPMGLPSGLPTSLPGGKTLLKMMGKKSENVYEQGVPGMVQDSFGGQQDNINVRQFNNNHDSPNEPNRPPPMHNAFGNMNAPPDSVTVIETDMKVLSDSDDEDSVELNQDQKMMAAHNRMRETTGERQCDEVRVDAGDDMNSNMMEGRPNIDLAPIDNSSGNPRSSSVSNMPGVSQQLSNESMMQMEQQNLENGNKRKRNLPQLHAAAPILVPFDRFGQSLHGRKDFVLQPFPYADRSHSLQARVVRVKEGMTGKMFPTYHLCLRNGAGNDETILLAAQKQTAKKSMSSYYLITLDPRCFQKGASTYVGKLRSNWSGTEYILYSDGDNPKKLKSLRGTEASLFDPNAQIREEMLAIKFAKPGNAPRRMVCVIPAPKPNNIYERQIFRSKPYTSLIHHATGKESLAMQDGIQFLRFANKIPVWDARRQTFTINFHGRVRQPSSKNFQLVENEAAEDAPPIVQFGRWTDDVFHLDGMWPFSALQIFALALSTFDTRVQEALKMTY